MTQHPVIPGYTILKHLGAGTFGDVFLAVDELTSSKVAIKVLKQVTDEHLRDFRREAQILDVLDHRHIVRILNSNLETETPFFVMEYCTGGSLQEWVENPKPLDAVLVAVYHAASGLKRIHERGGFHRDIKPANLLLHNDPKIGNVIKLADFGLARIPRVGESQMTYRPHGTPAYMAPELHHGEPMSAASDVYSLGATLRAFATGSTNPRALRARPIPKWLAQVLNGMTHADKLERVSISQVVDVMPALLEEHYGIVFTEDGVPTAVNLKRPPKAQPPAKANPSNISPLAQFLLGGAIGGLAILGAAAVITSLIPDADDDPET